MIEQRIGTDLTIEWPVEVEGVDDISTLDMSVYVKKNRFKKKMDFIVQDNVISFTFYGKDQVIVGTYDLELTINEGKIGQMVMDNKNIFKLVK